MTTLEGVKVSSAACLIYRENKSFTFYLSNDDLLEVVAAAGGIRSVRPPAPWPMRWFAAATKPNICVYAAQPQKCQRDHRYLCRG